MARHLPPLNALRAFEAAARLASFTKAATELHVTQAAISHQVKSLEAQLGIGLFRRGTRRLTLTEAGAELLPALKDALDLMDDALRVVQRRHSRRRGTSKAGLLVVSTLDSVAAKWLVPRLGKFRAAYPDIELRLSTTNRLVDLAREDIDVAIRYGSGDYVGLHADFLMSETLFPVCSPKLLDAGPPLMKPSDLAHHTLLHDDMPTTWAAWLEAAGVPELGRHLTGHAFEQSGLVVQAAVSGQGIALGRSALVIDDLTSGALVRPFALALPSPHAYYMVCEDHRRDEPKIVAFREFVLSEAMSTLAQSSSLGSPSKR